MVSLPQRGFRKITPYIVVLIEGRGLITLHSFLLTSHEGPLRKVKTLGQTAVSQLP